MTESMRCRGMRDILPSEMTRFRQIERAFHDVCVGWGYGEVRTPTIEHLHLFTAAGTLSPQMLERVYSFLDWDGWSGERVVLRPESTIPTARLYVEQLSGQAAARLFYVQNVLRFAEADDSREDWQCGVELIGQPSPQGDLEIIMLACEVLRQLGLDATVKLSDPAILRLVLSRAGFAPADQLALFDRVLEGDDTALDEVQSRLPGPAASLAGLLSMEGQGVKYLNNLRSALRPVIPEIGGVLDHLATISAALATVDIGHVISPVLVRNFEYYTGPVFHLYVGETKVGAGGRYDALISLVGGADVPASGFALDAGVISPLLSVDVSQDSRTVSIRVLGDNGASLGAAFSLARVLRSAGEKIEFAARAPARSSIEVTVSSGSFALTRDGAEPLQLDSVNDVVRALSEIPRD